VGEDGLITGTPYGLLSIGYQILRENPNNSERVVEERENNRLPRKISPLTLRPGGTTLGLTRGLTDFWQ